MATIPPDNRSIPELLSDALSQFSHLLRSELRLARGEMSEKIKVGMNGAAFLIGGALFVGPGIVLALMALAAFLMEHGWRSSIAYLLAAVVGFIVAAVLASIGLSRLQNFDVTPDRAIRQISRDAAAVKEQV